MVKPIFYVYFYLIFDLEVKIAQNDDEDVQRALEMYDRTSKLIRNTTKKSAQTSNSILQQVDDLISDPQKFVNQKYGANKGLSAKTCFIAMAAPSLTGKMQCAFSLRKVKPLYFVLSKIDDEQCQDIYRNFKELSKALADFAEIDKTRIEKIVGKSKSIGAK